MDKGLCTRLQKRNEGSRYRCIVYETWRFVIPGDVIVGMIWILGCFEFWSWDLDFDGREG